MNTEHVTEALYAGAMWMVERERPLDAAHFFRAMLLHSPTDERGWLGLGQCHEQLEQDAEAEELYIAATVAAERKVRCLVALARLYRRNQAQDEADRVLDDALDMAPNEDLADLVTQERERQ